jgi:hypothetical protein
MRKIVLWKRDDSDERARSIAKIAAADFAAQTKRRRFEKVIDDDDEEARRRRAQILGATGGSRDETQRERAGEGDDEIETNGSAAAGHHVSQLADLLAEATGGELTRVEILRWLLHHRDGRSLARAFKRQEAERQVPMQTRKNNMSTTENLIAVAKSYGMTAVCKHIIEKNNPHGIGESDFTAMATADLARFSNDRPDVAFARAFAADDERGRLLRKAHVIVKSSADAMDVTPLYVGGEAARNVNDPSEALAQLQELGRRRWPELTREQQFARAFSDPGNAELARKAHQRPAPTTNYAFPR